MLNPSKILIDHTANKLAKDYEEQYGKSEGADRDYAGIIRWAARMALENIATTDALYHNVEHTIMVTQVGTEILIGKHLLEGGVTQDDWLHVTIAMLCHDIGFVRGVCQADTGSSYTSGVGKQINLPTGATDAALNPYHVDRGKMFVRERFSGHAFINAERLSNLIERTRFPAEKEEAKANDIYADIVRSADLIGQLADPRYLHKLPLLYYEFEEIGVNAQLGYNNAGDLREKYPTFFWNVAHPYIQDSMKYLNRTQEGRQWVASLYRHVFHMEHREVLDDGIIEQT